MKQILLAPIILSFITIASTGGAALPKTNLSALHASLAERLQSHLHEWQGSVLHSPTGADYAR